MAAIVSRELGLPAVVGTSDATHVLHDEQEITVSCAGGDEGFVYEGRVDFETTEIDVSKTRATKPKIMLNMANPAGRVSLVANAEPTVSVGSGAWSSSSVITSKSGAGAFR